MSGGWSRASRAHYQMGRSGATLSFYDWPLITAALKAACFCSWYEHGVGVHCQMDIFIGTSQIVYAPRLPRPGPRLALQSAAVLRYEKSLGKCRNQAAITDGAGLREAADKACAARSVRVALTMCCQFMLCDKLSLFSLRLRRITSAESRQAVTL